MNRNIKQLQESWNRKTKAILCLTFMFIMFYPFAGNAQINTNQERILLLDKINWMDKELGWELDFNSNRLKSTQKSTLQLDSIREICDLIIDYKEVTEVFQYTANGQLVSSKGIYVNREGVPNGKVEYKTYNEKGQLLTHLIEETEKGATMPDTILVRRDQTNIYQNGNLVEEKILVLNENTYQLTNHSTSITSDRDTMTCVNQYEYNELNQLTYSKTVDYVGSPLFAYYPNISNERFYCYDENSRLKFLFKDENMLYKHSYENNGDTLFHTEKKLRLQSFIFENTPSFYEFYDGSKLWKDYSFEKIVYDDLGRIKLLNKEVYYDNFGFLGNSYQKYIAFRASFEYNSRNKLTHARYFLHEADPTKQPDEQVVDSSKFRESTHIDNTYDNEGNLLEYSKTFWDPIIRQWVINEKKTYYYSSTKSVATSVNNLESFKLKIYPNPAINFIILSEMPESVFDYRIYNLMGEKVEMGIIENSILPISHLHTGTYILELGTCEAVYRCRFIR